MPPTQSPQSTQFLTRAVPAADAEQIRFAGGINDDQFTTPSAQAGAWIAASRHELRHNRCIAIPTETVYGLAANALDSGAVESIFGAKGRPSDNPLIVHVSSVRMLRALYHLAPGESLDDNMQERLDDAEESGGAWPEIPHVYHSAIQRFWPGALTIVVPRPACIPLAVVGGHGTTVAVRLPAHPVARAIIAASGLPLAAPSANTSGRPSPTTAEHVARDLSGLIPLIIDGGACAVGVESTVVDAYSATAFVDGALSPCVLRPGGVTVESLKSLGGCWEKLRVYRRDFAGKELEKTPTTPGMKYRHYSPTAPVYLFTGASQHLSMQQTIDQLAQSPGISRIGVVAVGAKPDFTTSAELAVYCVEDARGLAHDIFGLLRRLDETDHVDAILVQGVDDRDEGLAVMNRLEKAASHVKHV
ncbi:hypothetical protein GGI20_003906 [Coemansia sp. BCRC 34301]|nr:hypothetical protein GGI20_003906 [Coemansia sp. BCRC 34301]